MNIYKIAQLGWTKRWASGFSLLGCSYWGVQYIKIAKRDLGEGFKHILFTHKEGITTCYRVKSETLIFGEHLAKKALKNHELVIELTEKLKKQADIIRAIISEPTSTFFGTKKFLQFEKEFDTYYPLAGFNNTVSEYLPPDILDKYQSTLEGARKYSESVYNETEEFFKMLTKNIAEKEQYDSKLMLVIFRDELAQYFKSENLPKQDVLKPRYNRSALFFDETKRHLLLGSDVDLLEGQIVKLNKLTTGIVKGNTACAGKARGVVRIIRDPKKFDIFNEGDILVTGMTRPDFVPLMKKAGAIVTDAGGILSHAAIVSRELNKPCVIGTETATNAFRDGDFVEVDADNGTVKKVE